MTHQLIQDLPALKIGTGWIALEILEEPTVKATFKGYAPIVRVRVLKTGLDYLLYIAAKSLADNLEPLRRQNGNRFAGIKFQIRKEAADQYAHYEIALPDSSEA